MKYSVDEIIDGVVKLENLDTRDIIYCKREDFNFEIHENDIVHSEDNKFYKDDKTKKERINMLKEKLERLKNSQFKE